jgi:hypothetical protein
MAWFGDAWFELNACQSHHSGNGSDIVSQTLLYSPFAIPDLFR